MNFVDSVKTCLINKYIGFDGRASRSEFWWFALFNFIILTIAALINLNLSNLIVLVLLLPSIGVTVRRLHDDDMSGWWILLNLIPIIGGLILLYFYIIKGTQGPNR